MSDPTPHGGGRRTAPRSGLEETPVEAPAPSDRDEFDEPDGLDAVSAGLGIEAPEADAVEQRREVRPGRDEPVPPLPPFDADPADTAEQHRVVELDEDDYR